MRQNRRHGIIAGAALGALPLLLSTGCSFDFSIGGPGAVDAEQVAERSSEILAEQVGETPDEFTCPEDLPAEVGAEIRCELTHGGETLGVTVTTTSVEGGDVQWDVVVDDTTGGDAAGDAPEEDTAPEEEAAPAGEASNGSSSGAASGGQVTNTEVINQSTAVLEAAGHSPENMVCDGMYLLAEVGAQLGCQFSENGGTRYITVTVTSVEGSTVMWDIEFDE
ncbi:DUF4333 domain-containing protein [Nocardiopsis sp. YSL2]|uniref:DUF4333 domain-containing protein n=1 Tax=Nocardiopsis sp. YSL2 TaxID=2939492 RepID=UPI0026F42134|nr:DUF4333 domain-containing protein [Nocardiopsis sp. YSL2]